MTRNYKKGKTYQDKGKAPMLLVQRKGLSLKYAVRLLVKGELDAADVLPLVQRDPSL
jgi:hypothetical protein